MIVKGYKPGDWYQDDHVGGFINNDGTLDVCVEYGLTDADTDRYAVEVQNGDGYYDSSGKFHFYPQD